MRPVERGQRPVVNGVAREYKEYGDARNDLIDRVGDYCSYCEIPVPSGPNVEHV